MNDMPRDPVLAQWLGEGPDQGSEHGINRALAAVHKVDQKQAWRFPQRWLPASVADVQVTRVVMIGLILTLTLLLLVALAAGFGGRNANKALVLAPTDEVIAYSDVGAIYVVSPDGSDRRDLNVGVANATAPVFSPDGTRVAFLTSDSPNAPGGRLLIAAVDGSRPSLIEASQGMEVLAGDVPNFSWSPDSTRIAFSTMNGANAQIFVINRDGSGLRAITDGTEQSDLPSWSPVGIWSNVTAEWVAYRVTRPEQQQITFERVHPDGAGLELVTAVVGPDSNLSKLSWSSPDQNQRVSMSYGLNAGFGSEARAVIDLGVGHQLDVWTNGLGGLPEAPTPWSPDAQHLAFVSGDGVIVGDDDRTSDLYDGQLQHLGRVLDCWVDWSPDGASLYGGAPNGCNGVVSVPLSNPGAATTITTTSGVASWRPVP